MTPYPTATNTIAFINLADNHYRLGAISTSTFSFNISRSPAFRVSLRIAEVKCLKKCFFYGSWSRLFRAVMIHRRRSFQEDAVPNARRKLEVKRILKKYIRTRLRYLLPRGLSQGWKPSLYCHSNLEAQIHLANVRVWRLDRSYVFHRCARHCRCQNQL